MDSGEVTDFTLNSIIPNLCSLSHEAPTVCMLTPLNHPKCPHDSIFFTADDCWIEFPQSGCPFPVCVWRVATAAGEYGATLPHSLNSHIAFSTGQVAALLFFFFYLKCIKIKLFSEASPLNVWVFVLCSVTFLFLCLFSSRAKKIGVDADVGCVRVCMRVCLSLLFLVSHSDESLAAHKPVSGAL